MSERDYECELCGGTGVVVVPIAWEDVTGTVHHDQKRQLCHGCHQAVCPQCDGTGSMLWRPPEQAGGVGEECTCNMCDGMGYVRVRARQRRATAQEGGQA